MLGVTHRDIKLENVLFTDTRDIKLIDFGFSTVCQPGKRLKVFCGTPSYMAPEIVRRTEYEGKPVDMWSLGILLYALLCGCFPFRAKSYPDLYRRIARGTFAIPEELSASVKDLLRQFLTVDVSQRINAQAALRHSWLQAQFATAPDINKLRLETPILISDKPSDDIDETTLAELDKFGLGKDDVVRLILTKTHSSIATFYYLLLDLNLGKRRAVMSKRGMSSSFGKSHSRSSSDQRVLIGGGDPYMQQQGQQTGQGFLRPKSASSSRQSSSNPQRPLSAFTNRR
jgi:serine/threonine protein kinase